MSTFGQVSSGGSTSTSSANANLLNRATEPNSLPPTSGTLTAVHCYLWLSAAGTTQARGLIYSAAGALLATGDIVTFTNTAKQEIVLPFSGAQQIHLAGGTGYTYGVQFKDPGTQNVVWSRSSGQTSTTIKNTVTWPTPQSTLPATPDSTVTGPIDMWVEYVTGPEGEGEVPAQYFNLDHWYLTEPVFDPADPTGPLDVYQPALDVYKSATFRVLDGAMVMTAPVQGATTSAASGSTRCEFREMTGPNQSDKASWGFADGGRHTLTVTMRADPTASTDRKEMIVGQIHDATGTPPVYIAVNNTNTPSRIQVFLPGGSLTPFLLSGVTPSTQFTYRMDVHDGQVDVYFCVGTVSSLPTAPQFSFPASTWPADQVANCYFKVGAYNKSAINNGGTGFVESRITYLDLVNIAAPPIITPPVDPVTPPTPSPDVPPPVPIIPAPSPVPSARLGVGNYEFGIYDRQGRNRLLQLRDWTSASWGRVRDDISDARVTLAFSRQIAQSEPEGGYYRTLASVRSMWHNLVIWRRDDSGGPAVRVWEGFITRIQDSGQELVIDAKDIMVVLHRRAILTGFDDSYPNIKSTVYRAATLIQQELKRDDPNISRYVTQIPSASDARQSRKVPPGQQTVFDVVDDMAANSGLDYTVSGRSILLFDTHHPIGTLPRLEESMVLGDLIVTEYGMDLTTRWIVASQSDNVFGSAGGIDPYYGAVEQISAPFSESSASADPNGDVDQAQQAVDSAEQALVTAQRALADDPANGTLQAQVSAAQGTLDDARTDLQKAQAAVSKSLEDLVKSLSSQAASNLSGHNPAPVVVRLPDGTRLSPDAPINIEELVPGSWVLLAADTALRQIRQWHKLDSVSVDVDSSGESVQISLSPAPGGGVPEGLSLGG